MCICTVLYKTTKPFLTTAATVAVAAAALAAGTFVVDVPKQFNDSRKIESEHEQINALHTE